MARQRTTHKKRNKRPRASKRHRPPPRGPAADTPEPLTLPDTGVSTVFVVAKVVITAALIIAFQYFDDMHGINLWNRWYSGEMELDGLHVPFANWDAQHYLLLADRGYAGHPHSHAFFPLYPLLIRLLNTLLGNLYVAAFILNMICSYLFCHLFYHYARHALPSRGALRALTLLLCYPTAFFLTVLYAEALFLFLLFGFLYCYDIRKSWVSLLFALLLPLVRAQAVFVAATLIVMLVIRLLRNKAIDYRYEAGNLAAFATGGLLYLGFFQVTVGDALSGIKAQGTFVFGNSLANLLNPGHFLTYLFSATDGSFSYIHSLVDKIFVVAMLLGIGLVATTRRTLWLVLYIMLVYPVAAMGAGGSFSRFALVAAPILALAVEKVCSKRGTVVSVIGALLLVVQLYFSGRFALNLWVG